MMIRVLLLLLVATPAMAAPFLIADVPSPNESTDKCVYTINGGAAQEISITIDNVVGLPTNNYKMCKVDLSGVPVGQNNVTLAVKSSLWGVTSAAVPFSFVRPAVVLDPASIRLVP